MGLFSGSRTGALVALGGWMVGSLAAPAPAAVAAPWNPVFVRLATDPIFPSGKRERDLGATIQLQLQGIPMLPNQHEIPLKMMPIDRIRAYQFRKPKGMYSHPSSLIVDLVIDVVDDDHPLPILVIDDEGTGSDGGPPIASDLGSVIQIDTGTALFTVPTSEGALFGEGWLTSQVLGPHVFSGLRAVDELGQVFSSTAGTAAVVLEISNSAYAEVVISGDLQLAGGSVPFASYQLLLSTYKYSDKLHGELSIEWPSSLLGTLELESGALQTAQFTLLEPPGENLVAMHDTASQQGFAMRQRFASPHFGFDLLGTGSGSARVVASAETMQLPDWETVCEFTLQLYDAQPTDWSMTARRFTLIPTILE